MSALRWKTAWILGASSGIGKQLAVDLASSGIGVVISARSSGKLDEVHKLSKSLIPAPIDIGDAHAVNELYKNITARQGPVDLVIICAAVWHPMGADDFDLVKAKQSFDINVGGVHNVLAAVMPGFIERGGGHIAIVASVAGYRGLPQAAAYGPTKAALIGLAESLYPDLAQYGVNLSIVNPGFVETPMTARNDFPMPFIISPQAASRRIINGLRKRQFEIAFPWRFVSILKFLSILPYPIYFWLIKNFVLKKNKK